MSTARNNLLTVDEVAVMHGVKTKTVYKWISKGYLRSQRDRRGFIEVKHADAAGFEPRQPGFPRGGIRKLTAADRVRIKRLRDGGATLAEIAEKFGVTPTGVWHSLRRE